MKRMGRRLALLAAAAAVLAALGTVPLAAPGPEGQADRFVGFHVAFGARQTPYDDGSWTEYGSQTLDTGRFGRVVPAQRAVRGVRRGAGPV